MSRDEALLRDPPDPGFGGRVLVATLRRQQDLEHPSAAQDDAVLVELAVGDVAVQELRIQAEARVAGDRRVLEQEAAGDADVLRARLLELLARLPARVAAALGVRELRRHAAQDRRALIAAVEPLELLDLLDRGLLDELPALLGRKLRHQIGEPQRAAVAILAPLVVVEPRRPARAGARPPDTGAGSDSRRGPSRAGSRGSR